MKDVESWLAIDPNHKNFFVAIDNEGNSFEFEKIPQLKYWDGVIDRVSHPRLNKFIDAAREAGAYGAKLSGSGKGGIMAALTSKENQNKVAKALANLGAKTFTTMVGKEGVRIEQ